MKMKRLCLLLLCIMPLYGCGNVNTSDTKNNQKVIISDYSTGKELVTLTKKSEIEDIVDSLSLDDLDEWRLVADIPKTMPVWKVTFYQDASRKAFQKSKDVEIEETLSVDVYAKEKLTATNIEGQNIHLGVPESMIKQIESFIE